MQRIHIGAMVSSPLDLVGVHPMCFLKKTQSSFEEAHHWNIQTEFYSVRIPTQLCMNDMKISMKYKYYLENECGCFLKEQQCCPFSLFISFSLFFVVMYFCDLIGSFYLSLICPLWDLFIYLFWDLLFVSSLGSFPHFKGNTLYFTRVQKIAQFTRSTHHKENGKLS